MRKFLSKDWLEVYNVFNEKCEEITFKKTGKEIKITFTYKNQLFTIDDCIRHHSFDLRTKKKDFIGFMMLNFIEVRANSTNWDKNGAYKHAPVLKELILSLFNNNELEAIRIAEEIKANLYIKIQHSIKIDRLQKQQALLFPDKLRQFKTEINLAINHLNLAAEIINNNKYQYGEIINRLSPDSIYSKIHDLRNELSKFDT